jgi:hypothetical protein
MNLESSWFGPLRFDDCTGNIHRFTCDLGLHDPGPVMLPARTAHTPVLPAGAPAQVLKETGAVALGDFRTELNVLQKVHHPHTVGSTLHCTCCLRLSVMHAHRLLHCSLSGCLRSQTAGPPGMQRPLHCTSR